MTPAPRAAFPLLAREGAIHFIGIGGAGMLPLAALVAGEGGSVRGSDRHPEAAAERLRPLGIPVTADDAPLDPAGLAALVVSSAVPKEHPQLRAAEKAGLPILKRAVALGEWVNRGRVVGVAGTHGKTTTTAMITGILVAAGLDPVGLVGGDVAEWGGHLRHGRSDLYVVEADEYDRSFHTLEPTTAIVTNVEADHLDIYGDLEGVREAFRHFLAGVRPAGRIVLCADDPGAGALVPWADRPILTYGFRAGTMLRGSDPVHEGGRSRMQVTESGVDRGEIALALPGRHNLLNALGAAAVARTLGVGWESIRDGLGSFRGVGRRYDRIGEVRGIEIVDDYAHHPTEVRALLAAAREVVRGRSPGTGRVVAIFQPHLYSRTRDFAAEFGEALAAADLVVLTEIHPAREAPIPGVDGAFLLREVRARKGEGVHFHPDWTDIEDTVVPLLRSGDLVLTIGAGPITGAGPRILAALGGA